MKWIFTVVTIIAMAASALSAEIHTAVESGDLTQIQSLIDSDTGCLELKNEHGLNPLNLASYLGKAEIVKLLLDAGADINAGDFENSQPLHNAAVSGNVDTLRVLLEHKGNIDARDDYQMTPLHFALNFRKPEAARFLVEQGADVNARNHHGGTPLIYASFSNDIELIGLLIKKGADPDQIGMNDGSALHIAAAQGQLEIARLYLENDANPNVKNSEGDTPLFWCGRERSLPVARLLIEHGADVLARNKHGGTCLHNAMHGNSVTVARFFVDQGCPINVMDNFGWSPLANASFGSPDVVEYLLMNGAKVDLKCSPVATGKKARKKGDKSADSCVCSPVSTALHSAVTRGHLDIAKQLVSYGADVNVVDQNGLTPLHHAARENYPDIVAYLLKNKAFPRVHGTVFGRTPLHLAAIEGNQEIVTQLLATGVNPDGLDTLHHSALDYAFAHNYRGIAYELLAAGANDDRLVDLVRLNTEPAAEMTAGTATVRYLGHSGWAIETPQHFLVFDYNLQGRNPDNVNASLANGYIVPEQLNGKAVTVFATHIHGDHYDRDIFQWKHNCPDMRYVLGFRPQDIPREQYHFVPHHTTRQIGDMTVTTILSNDTGVGFLVEVDGLTILHPGDHAWGVKAEKSIYEKEIDFLAGLNKAIDIGFVPITGCGLGDRNLVQQGAIMAAKKLKPAVTIPMHGGDNSQRYHNWVQLAGENGVQTPLAYAVDKGDVMVYRDGKIQKDFMTF